MQKLNSEMIIVHIVDSRFFPPSATLGFISDKTSLEDAKVWATGHPLKTPRFGLSEY